MQEDLMDKLPYEITIPRENLYLERVVIRTDRLPEELAYILRRNTIDKMIEDELNERRKEHDRFYSGFPGLVRHMLGIKFYSKRDLRIGLLGEFIHKMEIAIAETIGQQMGMLAEEIGLFDVRINVKHEISHDLFRRPQSWYVIEGYKRNQL